MNASMTNTTRSTGERYAVECENNGEASPSLSITAASSKSRSMCGSSIRRRSQVRHCSPGLAPHHGQSTSCAVMPRPPRRCRRPRTANSARPRDLRGGPLRECGCTRTRSTVRYPAPVRKVLCVVVAGLAVIGWSAAPAAAAKKPKPLAAALAGCRTLSVAYDPYIPEPSLRTRISGQALALLRKSKNPELSALVHGTAPTDLNSAYFADIGAWCKAHYSKDKVVRAGNYPPPTTTATATSSGSTLSSTTTS